MNYIGSRIYYELATGKVIAVNGQSSGEGITPSTIEQDFESFIPLTERTRESVGIIQLEYDQYADDFAVSNGYRVDPETQEILFSYPDPNEPEAPPVYRRSMSEQIADQEDRLSDVELVMAELLTGGM